MVGGWGGLPSEITADSKCLMNNVWKTPSVKYCYVLISLKFEERILTELSNNEIKFLKQWVILY